RNSGDARHATGADIRDAEQSAEVRAVTGPDSVVAEAIVVDARLADRRGADGVCSTEPGGGLRIRGDSLRGVVEQVHDVEIRRERRASVKTPVVKHLEP